MPTLASPPSTEHPLPAVLSLIGNTPLVEITRLDTGVCRLFVKLENENLGRSALVRAQKREKKPMLVSY